jgi:hypothetical protein
LKYGKAEVTEEESDFERQRGVVRPDTN